MDQKTKQMRTNDGKNSPLKFNELVYNRIELPKLI